MTANTGYAKLVAAWVYLCWNGRDVAAMSKLSELYAEVRFEAGIPICQVNTAFDIATGKYAEAAA